MNLEPKRGGGAGSQKWTAASQSNLLSAFSIELDEEIAYHYDYHHCHHYDHHFQSDNYHNVTFIRWR